VDSNAQNWAILPVRAKAFISLVVVAGTFVAIYGCTHPSSKNIAQFICYVLIAILASRLKVHLPGITGTMSVNFLFVLLGILELSFEEALILGTSAILVQCFYRDRPSPVQVTFNLCASAFAIGLAYRVYQAASALGWIHNRSVLLGIAAITYFVANTGCISTVISLTEHKSLSRIWVECYFWSFPYYLVGAAIADLLTIAKDLDWLAVGQPIGEDRNHPRIRRPRILTRSI